MRRKYREPENMRRVAVYEDEESMQPRKRRILFPVLITLFSLIFVVSAAVLVIELIVNPYVTDKNVGEIQKIYSEAGDTESVAPVSSEDDTADSERMAELERRREAVLKLQSVNSDYGLGAAGRHGHQFSGADAACRRPAVLPLPQLQKGKHEVRQHLFGRYVHGGLR